MTLAGYVRHTEPRAVSERTRRAYRAVLDAIAMDGQTVARAFGAGGWLPSVRDDPYPDARALARAAADAREGFGAVWVSDMNHNGTAFGDAGNLAFRAHHDAVHVIGGHDFTFAGEVATTAATLDVLHLMNGDAAAVIIAEIMGQGLYFNAHGSFPLFGGKQPTFHVTDDSVLWATSLLSDYIGG